MTGVAVEVPAPEFAVTGVERQETVRHSGLTFVTPGTFALESANCDRQFF